MAGPTLLAARRCTQRVAVLALLLLSRLAAPTTSLAQSGPTSTPTAAARPAAASCAFVLGFATLRDLVGLDQVGGCVEEQRFSAGGNAEQRTSGGLLVWRKADNWTAFTNGYQTWINGPFGLQQRLNTERFPWEASDPGALLSVTSASASAAGATASGATTPAPPPAATPAPLPPGTAVLIAAGDIAGCAEPGVIAGAEATARLIQTIDAPDATIAALGDNVYEDGTPGEFAACYDPTWGRFKARTRPAPGNHEYRTPDASGYFEYFGASAGEPGKGFYSYDLGIWHVVVIDSNCQFDGGCAAGSPQERWLRQDLAAHPAQCTVAYWHHPRFSSGEHGDANEMQDIWQALYDAHADIVLSGHDHSYERFAPQDAGGNADLLHGIRQFVVGTGGRSLYPTFTPRPNSQVRIAGVYGVMRLDLRPGGYDWRFISVTGAVLDSGSEPCR